MELKTCEYCGTSFDASLRQCPLCGKAVEPSPAEPIILNAGGEPAAPRRREKGGKRLAKNRAKPAAKAAESGENPYAIPKGMMKAICIIPRARRSPPGGVCDLQPQMVRAER